MRGVRGVHGFSLVELMSAAAIAGLLAAFALPSYRGYVLRANRVVGKAVLLEIAGRQESHFSERKTYSASLSPWYPVDAQGYAYFSRDGGSDRAASRSAIYRARLLTGDARGFRIEAEPVNAQARDEACGTLTYDNLGSRGASGALAAACWR